MQGGKVEIRKEHIALCKITNFHNSRKTFQATSSFSTNWLYYVFIKYVRKTLRLFDPFSKERICFSEMLINKDGQKYKFATHYGNLKILRKIGSDRKDVRFEDTFQA